MKKKRLFSLITVIGLTLISVIGCGSTDKAVKNEDTSSKTVDKVRIGFVDVTGSGKLSNTLGIAKDNGFVDEELKKIGAEAEFLPMTGAGPAINEALASKNLDIGNLGDVPAIIGKAAGIDTELISAAGLSNGASLIVPKDSTITSLKDLKGKKIATQKGAFMHKVLLDILNSNNLKVEDIQFVNLNAQGSADALVSGNVDGIVVGGITLGKLVLDGRAKVIVDYRDNPQWNTDTYTVVRTEFAREKPEIVKAVLKALVRAKKLSSEDSTASLGQWVKSGYSEETYKYLYPKNDYVDQIEIDNKTIVSGKSTLEFLKNNSLVKNNVDFDKWINTSYYDEVKNN